jgi:hypothetical protein
MGLPARTAPEFGYRAGLTTTTLPLRTLPAVMFVAGLPGAHL